MKIALCISGYLRTFNECYSSIVENVIQNNDVDIFIHTYDKQGESKGWINSLTNEISKEPFESNPANIGYVEFRPKLIKDLDLDFLEKIPYIKDIVVEKIDDLKPKFQHLIGHVSSFSNINEIAIILYKIYKCNQLKKEYELKHNFKYDLVIRTRGDQFYTKKINYDFPKEKILINAYPWGDEDFIENLGGEDVCFNDRFAVGTSENIDYLCDLYNNYQSIFENNIIEYSPIETLIKLYLNNKIDVEKRFLSFYVKHKPPRYKKK